MSRVSRIRLFNNKDRTDPILSLPVGTKTGETTADGSVFVKTGSAHKDGGTLWFYASENLHELNTTIEASGTEQAVTADGNQDVSVTGLTASTVYYLHYYYEDAVEEGAYPVVSTSFTTDASGGALDQARISALHFQKIWEPTAMAAS